MQSFLEKLDPCWTLQELENMAQNIESCLLQYKIMAKVIDYSEGATFTLFRVELASGVKTSRVTNLVPELCRFLCVDNIKLIPFLAGTSYIGLQITNAYRRAVPFTECFNKWIESDDLSPLSMLLGEDITGHAFGWDLNQMPHLLIAGVTCSGKSMLMHSLIISLLYRKSPVHLRFAMFDTSQLELSLYNDIPHLLFETISNYTQSIRGLTHLIQELRHRQMLLAALNQRSLANYNKVIEESEEQARAFPDPFGSLHENTSSTPCLHSLPDIIVCVDDYVQLIGEHKQIGEMLVSLCQQGHAVGIHLILTTRSPLSTSIGVQLRVNIPTRVALSVSSKIDSNLILDQYGAESLLGSGDMLLVSPTLSEPIRIQGAYVNDSDIRSVVTYCKQWGNPQYINIYDDFNDFNVNEELEPLFEQVVGFIMESQRASVSDIQRQFRIGYNRASGIIEQLENQGIIGQPDKNGSRHLL